MVVRVPDFKGELFPKGRVIVPCHTIFNSRKNILTEVAYSDDKSKVQVNQVVSKISNSNASNIPDSVMDNENDLWNRQLNRWWGWNWQRKRKECMTRFGHQFGDFPCLQDDDFFNEQCPCQILYNKSNKEMKKSLVNPVPATKAQSVQTSFVHTSGLYKMYRGRLKRNKQNNEYEGLLPEVSSNTDANITQKQHCLNIHLLNVHSNIFLGKKKAVIQTHRKSIEKTKNVIYSSDPGVAYCKKEETDSNISMKTNTDELTSAKTNNIVHSKSVPCSYTPSNRNSRAKSSESNSLTEQAIAEDLNLTSSKKDTDSEREPNWQQNYNKLKEEHNELLSAVCEILSNENYGGVSDIYKKRNCTCCFKLKMTQNSENCVDKENSK